MESQQIGERELERERKYYAELDDFKTVVSTPQGRRFVNRLLEQSGAFRLSFNPDNQMLTSYNEGKRSMGIYVLQLFDHCYSFYQQMITERNYERNSNRNPRASD